MKEPKHRTPRPPGPRHLARLRLSTVVRALELERADLRAPRSERRSFLASAAAPAPTAVSAVGPEDVEQHDWWKARQARALELGARS